MDLPLTRWDFPGGSDGKEPACNVGDPGSILGSGRAPGDGTNYPVQYSWGFPDSSVGKESASNAGAPGWVPGLGRSAGERKKLPTLVSCLENPMDRGAWQATVHGVTRLGHDLVIKPPPPPPTRCVSSP